MNAAFATVLDRARLARAADWLVAFIAMSLPFSTSVTGILTVIWLLVLLPTLDLAAVRRELMSAAGGLAVALWGLAVVGMLWASVSFGERFHGLSPYFKLLVIPLLFVQFRRSGRVWPVALAFLAAATVLLFWSYWVAFAPGLTWRGKEYGVPVKDYIAQSGIFVLCMFGLVEFALKLWNEGRRALSLASLSLAGLFFLNITFVATGRTALVILPVLVSLFGLRHFNWRGWVAMGVIGAAIGGMIWTSSPYLQKRVLGVGREIERYHSTNDYTSSGERLEFWKKAVRIVTEAPVIGHGTGSIRDQYSKLVSDRWGPSSLIPDNPHQQVFAVAIQLGSIGVAVLFAMWISHLLLFPLQGSGAGLAAWIGLVVVVQNIVGSLFNSHLFDFTQGWIYVVGVGVFGGYLRHLKDAEKLSTSADLGVATRRKDGY